MCNLTLGELQMQRSLKKKVSVIEERLIHRIDSDCTGWLGTKADKGYPKLENERCSRLLWTWYKGAIPSRQFVLHRCDNPECLNLEHLELGSPQDNAAQRGSRRTHINGRNTKLSRRDINLIRGLWTAKSPKISVTKWAVLVAPLFSCGYRNLLELTGNRGWRPRG